MIELNDIEIGDFKVDLFINDNGKLGITVYKPKDDEHSRDIFVDKNLDVIC